MMRSVEIIGGGLAGLGLGLGLRRAGADVTVFEAGSYPRHRVCGEFISGLGETTIARLGLAPLLADAQRLDEVEWFFGGRPTRRQRLPSPALAVSRYVLDARMAEAFIAAGGRLLTATRVEMGETPEGRVFSTGRRRASPSWLGLKLHARGLPLTRALEFHLGEGAYVGLCPVEEGRTNVCGLFRQRPDLEAKRETVLAAYLRAAGLGTLAARLDTAEVCPESRCAVAGVGFDRGAMTGGRMSLGDAFALIPPFTGNGMAMALQSAELAIDPLVAWAHGELRWADTLRLVRRRLRRRFACRLAAAEMLHPFLHDPPRQRWLAATARAGILPLQPLYHLLH